MFKFKRLKISAGMSLAAMLIFLLSSVSVNVLTPNTAHADIVGIAGGLTVPTADLPNIWERVAVAVGRAVAFNFAQKYLNNFTNKLQQKYKIRNFLYYDQVLTNYYLGNYIRDKVRDPDLQQIYTLFDAAYITGQSTGTSGQPDPAKALIPRLKKAIYKYYIDQGGTPEDLVFSPPPTLSDSEYFAAAQSYFFNPPGFVETNLRGQFGAFQANATTAAQLEVIVGNGLKAGRLIGGTCEFPPNSPGGTTAGNPDTDPQACQQAGGVWKASALDQARSFIDNPTIFIQSYLDQGVAKYLGNNFDPNNFWAKVGATIGNFISNAFLLNKSSGGVLSDSPQTYTPLPPSVDPTQPQEMDLDGDGIPDAYDYNNDGVPDVCIIGGTPPNCTGSKDVLSPPPPPTTIPCTPYGDQVATYMLSLLKSGTPPDQVAVMTNQQFGLPNASFGTVSFNASRQILGFSEPPLAEFYIAGPNTNPDAPPDWTIMRLCDLPSGGGVPPPADALTKHPDQSGVVASVKATLVSQGVNLTGACGAFAITKNVAWQMKGSGAGLLSKPSGSNCNNFATDIIAYPDGYIYDILGDGGGANNPQWLPVGCGTNGTCASRYVAAPDPATLP